MSNELRSAATDMKPIAEGHGMCIATERVTVDGQQVGNMYREESAFPNDSGWRFTAGTETDEYGDNPDNWEVLDLGALASFDGEIVPFLDAPVGSQLVRWPAGAPLAPVPSLNLEPETPRRQALGTDWWIELPGQFAAEMVNGGVQLISLDKPSRIIWADIWKPPSGDSAGADQLAADIRAAVKPSGAREYDEPGSAAGEIRIGYWCEETGEGGAKHWILYAYTIRPTSFVQAAFMAAAPDPEWALTAWRSLRYVPAAPAT